MGRRAGYKATNAVVKGMDWQAVLGPHVARFNHILECSDVRQQVGRQLAGLGAAHDGQVGAAKHQVLVKRPVGFNLDTVPRGNSEANQLGNGLAERLAPGQDDQGLVDDAHEHGGRKGVADGV